MSDIKPKLILRPGVNISEKALSPSTKLMLNHGKPNFTINRSKSKNDSQSPPTPSTPEASQVVLKSTTFNGFIKPSTLNISTENEVNKVVLRRTRLPEASDKPPQDDEPEFIKAQRKIAERLAKENNLDFENRKSGYFTHVMMSPTTPTKTMEFPVIENARIQKPTVLDAADVTEAVEPIEAPVEIPKPTEEAVAENGQATVEEPTQNGHENTDLIQFNGTTAAEEKPTEVVQVAKTLIEEVVPAAAAAAIIPEPAQNGLQNGDSHPQENDQSGTPPQSDVNFEPKTVVSFSKELSSEPNNYPDTVKVTTEVEPTKDSELIQEMSKLKFDINADSEDVKVTPVLRTE